MPTLSFSRLNKSDLNAFNGLEDDHAKGWIAEVELSDRFLTLFVGMSGSVIMLAISKSDGDLLGEEQMDGLFESAEQAMRFLKALPFAKMEAFCRA